jgi:hypothetical protein
VTDARRPIRVCVLPLRGLLSVLRVLFGERQLLPELPTSSVRMN